MQVISFTILMFVKNLFCTEAGWVLMPWAHGQGYASEAVKTVAPLNPNNSLCKAFY
jgi:RimJ/RimL family protein N-acetyltransferase